MRFERSKNIDVSRSVNFFVESNWKPENFVILNWIRLGKRHRPKVLENIKKWFHRLLKLVVYRILKPKFGHFSGEQPSFWDCDHCVRKLIHCSIQFRMRIILWTILATFLVFPIKVPESSRNCSACTQTSEFKRKSSGFEIYPVSSSRFNLIPRTFIRYSALNFLGSLCDKLLINFWSI